MDLFTGIKINQKLVAATSDETRIGVKEKNKVLCSPIGDVTNYQLFLKLRNTRTKYTNCKIRPLFINFILD